MQVFTGLPISQGLAAGKIIFLGTQETVVRQAGSPQEEQARIAAAQQQAQGYHWYAVFDAHPVSLRYSRISRKASGSFRTTSSGVTL